MPSNGECCLRQRNPFAEKDSRALAAVNDLLNEAASGDRARPGLYVRRGLFGARCRRSPVDQRYGGPCVDLRRSERRSRGPARCGSGATWTVHAARSQWASRLTPHRGLDAWQQPGCVGVPSICHVGGARALNGRACRRGSNRSTTFRWPVLQRGQRVMSMPVSRRSSSCQLSPSGAVGAGGAI